MTSQRKLKILITGYAMMLVGAVLIIVSILPCESEQAKPKVNAGLQFTDAANNRLVIVSATNSAAFGLGAGMNWTTESGQVEIVTPEKIYRFERRAGQPDGPVWLKSITANTNTYPGKETFYFKMPGDNFSIGHDPQFKADERNQVEVWSFDDSSPVGGTIYRFELRDDGFAHLLSTQPFFTNTHGSNNTAFGRSSEFTAGGKK